MFCREQVAQLSPIEDELNRLGVSLVVIGPGTPAQARAFKQEHGTTLPLYVDPGLKAYKALGMKRGLAATLGPASVMHALRALTAGHRQGPVQGDPWQQGGVALVMPDGAVPYLKRSESAGDHPDPRQLVAVAREAVS